MIKSSYILLILFVHGYKINGFTFSDQFKVCHQSDSNLDSCLAEAIANTLRELGKSGVRSIGVPPIDPLKIDKITIGAGTTAVQLVQNYREARLLGLANVKVANVHFDPEKLILTFATIHPQLQQLAKYNLNGKILVLPVYGDGDSDILLKDPTIQHSIQLKEETRGGKKYFQITEYIAKITIQGAHFDFTNLFNGDKALSDNILKVINENWSVIFEDVKPGIDKTYSKVFEVVANSLFSKIPIDELLPK